MSILLEEINKRTEWIIQRLTVLEKDLRKAPEGRLRIRSNQNHFRYYLMREKNDHTGKYIRRRQVEIAAALAQKEYDRKIIRSLQDEQRLLQRLQGFYETGSDCCEWYYGPEEGIWSKLPEARKVLVRPFVQTRENYVEEWLSESYEPMPFYEDDPEYVSDNGIRVRSKTELIIINMLEKRNIPFCYERPLYLQGMGEVHPDFTVSNVRKRKTLYWEHLGMMDDPEYYHKALRKIEAYEKNGYFPGADLILTHETSERPVSTRILEKTIETYLL